MLTEGKHNAPPPLACLIYETFAFFVYFEQQIPWLPS